MNNSPLLGLAFLTILLLAPSCSSERRTFASDSAAGSPGAAGTSDSPDGSPASYPTGAGTDGSVQAGVVPPSGGSGTGGSVDQHPAAGAGGEGEVSAAAAKGGADGDAGGSAGQGGSTRSGAEGSAAGSALQPGGAGGAGTEVDPECISGATDTCWETEDGVSLGEQPQEVLGDCRLGERTCSLAGFWGPCVGAVGPADADACDVAGSDGDCNGIANEGCACTDGDTRPCGTDEGNCVAGTQSCDASAWGPCEGQVAPAAQDRCEVAGDDASCNAIPNEGCPCIGDESEDCGDCGTRTCSPSAREWGACTGRDEAIDCWEDATGTPFSDPMPASVQGNCVFGERACQSDGTWGECVGAVGPEEADNCDVAGDDADCNGVENEGCACLDGEERPCGSSVGNCQTGTQRCMEGVWKLCDGGVGPEAQDSCVAEGDDADCNGTPNEGCPCIGSQTGSCNDCGVRTCAPASRSWGPCQASASIVECDPANGDQLRSCNATGSWVYTSCTYGCLNNQCNECEAGDTRCSGSGGTLRQECVDGSWQTVQTCTYGCGGSGTLCLVGPGGSCSAGSQCASGYCVDGVCCNTQCPALTCSDFDVDCTVHPSLVDQDLCDATGQCRPADEVCAESATDAELGASCLFEGAASECDASGNCIEPPVFCGYLGYCDLNEKCCYASGSAAQCTTGLCNNAIGIDLLVSCDENSDCATGEVCCVGLYASGGTISCVPSADCSNMLCGSPAITEGGVALCQPRGQYSCNLDSDGVPADFRFCQ